MGFGINILADSISPAGIRLLTVEATYPRIIHAEMMTHRHFSRNAASSRAIPVAKLIERVEQDPFIPTYWGKNQKGMQAGQEIDPQDKVFAEEQWLWARDRAVQAAKNLGVELGVHKQLANRLLEPFQWYTAIYSATEWDNFFGLRCHPDAQPEIQVIANLIRDGMRNSTPVEVAYDDWHLPLVRHRDEEQLAQEGFETIDRVRISTGRVCRVSYTTHHGTRDPNADLQLCEQLINDGHMSPLEHPATPAHLSDQFYGNFRGWIQYRKFIPHESNFMSREVS